MRAKKWAAVTLVSLLAVSAAGCGSSHDAAKPPAPKPAPKPAPVASLMSCLQSHGYEATPETPAAVATAPARFQFTAVWNVLNPSRVSFALAFSRTLSGAEQAAVWTRETNAKMGRSVVVAPVVRLGRVDVLWTAKPGVANANAIYGCVKRQG